MTDLGGKVALVTAAANGIGRASAPALADAGAGVVATDIDGDALRGIEGGITARRLDVLDRGDIVATVEAIGPIDILFDCAGVVHSGTVLEMTHEELELAWRLSVVARIDVIRAVPPGMIERRDGCIINMASVAGSPKGVPDRLAHGTTKAAVVGLTKAVAADHVAQGIRCNAVRPGTVDSPSLQERLHAGGDYKVTRAAFVGRQPMGRIGTAEEIADLVVHLAGATHTTGRTRLIDGGWAN